MPRTTKVEPEGCPPIRALTFDELGLIKVIESRGKQGGTPQVVERWGEPDASKCVLAASIHDRKSDPLLAIARKSGQVEVISAVNGERLESHSIVTSVVDKPEDDAVSGIHLFRKGNHDSSSRSCTLLTCTIKGNARIIDVPEVPEKSDDSSPTRTWKVSAAGDVLCSKVNGNETHALFGGKGIEVNVWDIENCTKIWTAKPPPKNSIGIFTPPWFTSATFLEKDDHRKIVAGTNNHQLAQVRLYDLSAQRRSVLSFDFRESSIKSITEDLDGYTVYVGNGSGDLASFDMRTGKLLGCFLGKCSGSIRSIARHPELPVIASCGLDRYLRIWDTKTRQLLSAVFLKQHLTQVVIDSNFVDELPLGSAMDPQPNEVKSPDDIEDEDEVIPMKRKKGHRENGTSKKLKSKKRSKKLIDSDDDDL